MGLNPADSSVVLEIKKQNRCFHNGFNIIPTQLLPVV